MKQFKITDEPSLPTKVDRNAFVRFMKSEYDQYITIERNEVLISAHDENDFQWFISEYIKSK